jgi:hypothetical protein
MRPEAAGRDRALDHVREAVGNLSAPEDPLSEQLSSTAAAARTGPSDLSPTVEEWSRTVQNLLVHNAELERQLAELLPARELDALLADGRLSTEEARTVLRRAHNSTSPGNSYEHRESWLGEAWRVRHVPAGSAPGKRYRCPGCDQEIPPGVSHVVAWPEYGGVDDRRHWHTACWNAKDRRSAKLRRSNTAPRN